LPTAPVICSYTTVLKTLNSTVTVAVECQSTDKMKLL